jgi:ABC-type nitrate/sulfonate/bicarbonate transport system substrate-binding protein
MNEAENMLKEQPSESCATKKYVFRQLTATVIVVAVVGLLSPSSWSASAPIKVTIHVPSKSLSIMPYYFGKDKGFFGSEQIEPQLVMMAPPTAIAALVSGELDFSTTTGAATSAMMRGLSLKRTAGNQIDTGTRGQGHRRNLSDGCGGNVDDDDSPG